VTGASPAPGAATTTVVDTPDGAALHVPRRGAGRPVVLVHGVTLTAEVWTRQLASLPDRGFDVVAYDQRGHGRSRVGAAGWSMAVFGRDLAVVLEAADLRDAIVVGHSMGGVTAQELLLHHRALVAERVAGVVLLSTTVRPHVGLTRRIRLASRHRLPAFDPARIMAVGPIGRRLARVGFGARPRPADVELTRRLLASCPPETSREAVRALFEFDGTAGLPGIDVPVLVAGGTRDVITPVRDLERIAELVPGARLELFVGAGHMAMLEQPEAFDDALVRFAATLGPVGQT
jgi:non-heme chloroperoxidase